MQAIYDYIVVGAGSAGCAVAARLAQDKQTSVLLLEAGPADKNIWIHIPIGYGKTMFNPQLNWQFKSEPEPFLNNRQIYQPRGRTLGGSSSINGLVYIRGQSQDFDAWEALGNEGWGWRDVLPYFKRSEGNERGESALHGGSGPLSVSNIRGKHELVEAFIGAANEIGVPRTTDFNGAVQEGAGYFQLTTRNGRRWSTARGYLKPARKRGNVAVVANALTTRLLFEGRRAVGVEYIKDGGKHVARANAEVIVSGGAFNSPQLLQLSGVGPADLLQQHGIAVIADMKGVGADLQDHYQARFNYRGTTRNTINDMMGSVVGRVAAGLRYALLRKGFLTIGAGYAGGFFKTDPSLPTPDVQFHFILFSADSVGQKLHPWPGFLTSVCQLRPESRGFVRIKSADPAQAPAIQPRYLTAQVDRDVMVAGMKLIRRVMGQPAMARYIDEELMPGAKVQTDAELLEFARQKGTTVFHPTSTCRMGSDVTAVVDERLRVHGFQGLRVADASIMPTVVSGNTNAACVMIGEKASDMILEDATAKPAAKAA